MNQSKVSKKSTQSTSKSSLHSLDNGYYSAIDDEDEGLSMSTKSKSLSNSSLNITVSSADKQCFDISEEVLAEIEVGFVLFFINFFH